LLIQLVEVELSDNNVKILKFDIIDR